MSIQQDIINALTELKVEVEPVGNTLNLKIGRGLRAKKANIDPSPFVAKCNQQTHDTKRLQGYIQGVYRALEEPINHRSESWDYAQCAGGMMPELQSTEFVDGFEAVQGTPPWFQPLGPDVILTTALVVDRGVKTISKQQVEKWGATDDRMFSAGRSMLFHKTRDYIDQISKVGDGPVHAFKLGDGFDASRCMVIADILFSQLDEFSMLFGLPHQDMLLYVPGRDKDSQDALMEETTRAYNEAQYPLSTALFELVHGRPQPFQVQ